MINIVTTLNASLTQIGTIETSTAGDVSLAASTDKKLLDLTLSAGTWMLIGHSEVHSFHSSTGYGFIAFFAANKGSLYQCSDSFGTGGYPYVAPTAILITNEETIVSLKGWSTTADTATNNKAYAIRIA